MALLLMPTAVQRTKKVISEGKKVISELQKLMVEEKMMIYNIYDNKIQIIACQFYITKYYL